jgi:hypothetical protein
MGLNMMKLTRINAYQTQMVAHICVNMRLICGSLR